jgi:hypothetical protein
MALPSAGWIPVLIAIRVFRSSAVWGCEGVVLWVGNALSDREVLQLRQWRSRDINCAEEEGNGMQGRRGYSIQGGREGRKRLDRW